MVDPRIPLPVYTLKLIPPLKKKYRVDIHQYSGMGEYFISIGPHVVLLGVFFGGGHSRR